MFCEYDSESSSYLGMSWIKNAIHVDEDEGVMKKKAKTSSLKGLQTF